MLLLSFCARLESLRFAPYRFHEIFSINHTYFAKFSERWQKWIERHQQLPLSIARLGCSSLITGRWSVDRSGYASAIGQDFARALLHVLWDEESGTKLLAGQDMELFSERVSIMLLQEWKMLPLSYVWLAFSDRKRSCPEG